MKKVAVFADDEIVAHLYWDGEKIRLDGPEDFRFLIERPVRIGLEVYEASQGEAFLAYSGSRLRCGNLEVGARRKGGTCNGTKRRRNL
jgi:hypothetical protein